MQRSSGSWGDPGGGSDCAECGAAVAADSAFCNNCGAKQQDRCAACGQMNAAGSAYCRSCGANLTASTAPALEDDPDEPVGWGAQPTPREQRPFSAECPRCHAVNEPSALFCFSCGLPMDEGEQVRRRLGASTIGPGLVPVGFWARLFALIIDVIAVGILSGIIGALVQSGAGLESLWTGWGWVMWPIYYTVGVSVWSTTLGKRLIGAYVLRPDGSKVSVLRAFGRWLAYLASAVLLFLGFLIVAFRNDKLALHDMICSTVVVYRR